MNAMTRERKVPQPAGDQRPKKRRKGESDSRSVRVPRETGKQLTIIANLKEMPVEDLVAQSPLIEWAQRLWDTTWAEIARRERGG